MSWGEALMEAMAAGWHGDGAFLRPGSPLTARTARAAHWQGVRARAASRACGCARCEGRS